jgi:nucleoid-associated protein YgaU
MSDHEWTPPGADQGSLSPPDANATPADDGTDSAVKTSARRGFRMPASLATLSIGRFRRGAKAGPSAEVETSAEAGSSPAGRAARRRLAIDWHKLPFATASRETRVGVAALLSFLILVTALILNRGDKGKSTLLAMESPQAQVPAKGTGRDPAIDKGDKEAKPPGPAATPVTKPMTEVVAPPALPKTPAEGETVLQTSVDSPPRPTEPTPAPPPSPTPLPKPTPVKPVDPPAAEKKEQAPPVDVPSLPDLPGPASPAPVAPGSESAPPNPNDKPEAPAPVPTVPPVVAEGPPPVPGAEKPAAEGPPPVPGAEKPGTASEPPSLPTGETKPGAAAPPSTDPTSLKPIPSKPADLLPIDEPATTRPAAPAPETRPAPPEVKAGEPASKPPVAPDPDPAPPDIPKPRPVEERPKPAETEPRKVDKAPTLAPPPGATPIPDEATQPATEPATEPDPTLSGVAPASSRPAGMMSIPNSRTSRPTDETLEGRLAPPATVADAPMPREETGSRDQVDPILHTVQGGENFWTISRLYYNSGRYYRALHAANRKIVPKIRELYVGTTIKVPPIETLDPTLIDPPTKARPSPTSTARDDAPSQAVRASKSTESGRLVPSRSRAEVELGLPIVGASRDRVRDEVEEPARPTYKVRAHDTLRSIARDTLGDSRRYREILDLNRDVIDDPLRLVSGQSLTLPDDAIVGRRPR